MSGSDSKKYIQDEYVDEGYFVDPEASSPDVIIDSSKWTGLPSDFQLTEQRRTELCKAIEIAEVDLEHLGATNAEKAQARAYIIAIRALAEAPEPPAEQIWNLLTKAATIATIAQIFIPLIQALTR